MRAARIATQGAAPTLVELPTPEPGREQALLRVRAAGLNPVDLAIARGGFYVPTPAPPYVPGAEVVGEVLASDRTPVGTRVWALSTAGAFAEQTVVDEARLVPVPAGVSDAVAAACGVAGLAGWMPVLTRGELRRGEAVLVLGASGVVGQVAIQAARRGGARRVVGLARSPKGRERARALGADAVVGVEGDRVAALRAALEGRGADLVVDALWGESVVAAISVLARGGRIVQVGNAESPTAAIVPGTLRGGRNDIRGFSIYSEDLRDVARCYGELATAAAGGEVAFEVETVALGDLSAAWERQRQGSGGVKLVVTP